MLLLVELFDSQILLPANLPLELCFYLIPFPRYFDLFMHYERT